MTDTNQKAQGTNSGLGIAYPPDSLLNIPVPNNNKIAAGARAPDVLVQNPGSRVPVRLFSLFKNVGRLTIIVFAGAPAKTGASIKAFRDFVDGSGGVLGPSDDLLQYLTVIRTGNENGSPDETLGVARFGRACYDVDGAAYERYGVKEEVGLVVVVRPDGHVGMACGLEEGERLRGYFDGFVREFGVEGGGRADVGSSDQVGRVDVRGRL